MKACIVLNDDFSAWHFRRNILLALLERGVEVTVVSPNGPYVSKLTAMGVRHVAVPMCRFFSPLRDLLLIFRLYRVIRRERPDIVHTMTVKPNTYGAIAARLAGTPRTVALVCGLGQGFLPGGGWKQWLLRRAVSWLYWLGAKFQARLWFQNADDFSLFVESGLIKPGQGVVIRGSGIHLDEFSIDKVDPDGLAKLREELGVCRQTRVVLMMVLRLLWSKGVREFVEAASLVQGDDRRPVKFLLVGPLVPESPDAVPEAYLRSAASSRFQHLDYRTDVKELLALADIVTLPSYYREGVPRVLLEAMAMKKPIVTTDNVGCREVVDEGRNGFLVPVRDSAALASAIETLLGDDALRRSFGNHARSKVRAEFEESIVMAKVMKELYGLDSHETEATPSRDEAA